MQKCSKPKQTSGGEELVNGEWVWDKVEWSKCSACGVFHSNRLIPARFWEKSWKSEPKKNTAGVVLMKTVRVNGVSVDKFLMVQSYHNSFGFPKGKVETGETTRQAAEREFFEETGTAINLDKCMEIRHSVYSSKTDSEKIISFFIKRVPAEFNVFTFPISDNEITSFGWISDCSFKYFKINKMSQDVLDVMYRHYSK